jgi:hypothetical protein
MSTFVDSITQATLAQLSSFISSKGCPTHSRQTAIQQGFAEKSSPAEVPAKVMAERYATATRKA